MFINRHNYEVYLVDYLDGKLNPSQVAELMAFLQNNLDIQGEFDGLQDAVLVDKQVSYPNKSDLKKNSFLKNGIENEFDYLCIASVEGDITLNEKKRLDYLLKKEPNKIEELSTFKKTTIYPDTNKIFTRKGKLKRTIVIPIHLSSFRFAASIAASVVVILTVYSIFKFSGDGKTLNNISSKRTPLAVFVNEKKEPEQKQIVVKPSATVASMEYQKVSHIIKTEILQESIKDTNQDRSRVDSIPNLINRIESIPININKNYQEEQLAIAQLSYLNSQYNTNINQTLQIAEYNQHNSKVIGVFEIIQYGIKSFGKLIGRDVKLEADKDKNGRIEKINFESQLFAFSAPVGKKE